MGKLKQQPLFVVPTVDSRFTRETLRRGGPREVQGRRWRKKLREAEEMGGGGWEKLVDLGLPRLKKMR